jgi:hypothetical protein
MKIPPLGKYIMSVQFITHIPSHRRFIANFKEILGTAHEKGIAYVPEVLDRDTDYTICLCGYPSDDSNLITCTEVVDLHVSVTETTGRPFFCGTGAIQKAIFLILLIGKLHEPLNMAHLSEVPWISEVLNDNEWFRRYHSVLAMNSFHLQPR